MAEGDTRRAFHLNHKTLTNLLMQMIASPYFSTDIPTVREPEMTQDRSRDGTQLGAGLCGIGKCGRAGRLALPHGCSDSTRSPFRQS